jgi:signal transduction histidine kinase
LLLIKSYIVTELLKNSYRATVERHAKKQDAFSTNRASEAHIPAIFISIAKSSTHLSIRIRDQGGGISPKNLPQIFQYTFTTAGHSEEEEESKKRKEEEEDNSGPYAMQNTSGIGAELDGLGALNGGGDVGLTSGMGTLAGLGYGLPMSRIYAEHGRGALDVVSLYGHGCDTYIKVPANLLSE